LSVGTFCDNCPPYIDNYVRFEDRCLQTAQPVSKALGIPIYVEHGEELIGLLSTTLTAISLFHPTHAGIAERYRPVVPGTGLHPRPGPVESLKPFFSEIDPSWSSIWYPPRTGEDVEEIHNRVDGFLDAFVIELERRFPREHQRILLVSHAATVVALARTLLGDRLLSLRIGCCSLSEFVHVPGNAKWTWKAERLADGAHLKDGSQREWGFPDIEVMGGKVCVLD